MTPFAWGALTVLIAAAAVNQGFEALGRIGRLLSRLGRTDGGERK